MKIKTFVVACAALMLSFGALATGADAASMMHHKKMMMHHRMHKMMHHKSMMMHHRMMHRKTM